MTLQSPNEALQPEVPPPPPPERRSRRRPTLAAISGFLSFLLIAAVACMFGLIWSQQRLREPGPLVADKVLFIAPGTDFPDIIAQLDREGVIDSPMTLNVALVVEGSRSKVRAGEYLFKQRASMRDVMETLVSGRQVLHAITIPEGLTSEQIVQRLRDVDVLAGDIREIPKEGSILPETYKVARGMPRADLLRKMQDDQKHVVDQIWARRSADIPLRSPFELVTLASIVEKETGKADERSRVAGVFMNRLTRRMRLQSDPTIVYGLVGGKGTLGRGISRAELDRPTPYNTYAVDGLPPGPIANPGRAALEAVANPSRTQELYFVADGTGGHVFAETLDQHSRNVQRWRQIERDAKDKAASDVDKAPPAVPGREQRGDADGEISVYGALSSAFGPAPGLRMGAPSVSMTSAVAAIAQAAPQTPAFVATTRPPAGKPATKAAAKQPASAAQVSAFAMGTDIEKLGIKIQGVNMDGTTGSALDGPSADDADMPVDNSTFQMSPTRRAEQKARAVKLGLAAGSDDLPPEAPAVRQNVAAANQPNQPIVHARAFDASEGTPLDPLLDKSYDLNHPKTVPQMR